MPAAPVRSSCQSMPRWYWLLSCTSTTVASISTWRLALASTWSRNSCTFSCWREVARTVEDPGSRDWRSPRPPRGTSTFGPVASAATATPLGATARRPPPGCPGVAGCGGVATGGPPRAARNDLVGLAQDFLDVLDQRVPELVGCSGSAPKRAKCSARRRRRRTQRRRPRRPRHPRRSTWPTISDETLTWPDVCALHVHVVDPVDRAGYGESRITTRFGAVDLVAHVDLPGDAA